MNREELKKYLPHREPMLLVDEVEIDEEGVAHAKYRIREDEFFCRGHFPGNPIVPGVIQCEIMAQSCVLLVKDEVQGKTTLYTGINNVKFKNIVRPGDLCEDCVKMLNFGAVSLGVLELIKCKALRVRTTGVYFCK